METETSLPTELSISAWPTGDSAEIRPAEMSAYGKILEKEGKMHILQHKCALGLTRLSMLSHPSCNMFK